MPYILLRCRDAGISGTCDYETGADSFDEAARRLKKHVRELHALEINNQEIAHLLLAQEVSDAF